MVGPEVELAPGVEVGPFCLLDGAIRIGARTLLIGHVTILGEVEMGEANVVHPNAVIGGEPQDLAYSGGLRRVRSAHATSFARA